MRRCRGALTRSRSVYSPLREIFFFHILSLILWRWIGFRGCLFCAFSRILRPPFYLIDSPPPPPPPPPRAFVLCLCDLHVHVEASSRHFRCSQPPDVSAGKSRLGFSDVGLFVVLALKNSFRDRFRPSTIPAVLVRQTTRQPSF